MSLDDKNMKILEELKEILEKQNVLDNDILTTTTTEYLDLGLLPEQIDKIKKITAKNSFMGFKTAAEIEDTSSAKYKTITFGCDALDSITNGGIACSGITEIYGESGAGKTQICYQMALTVQLPLLFGGLNKGAIVICTESRLSIKRLHQMSEHLNWKYKDKIDTQNFLDNIYVEFIPDLENLIQCCEIKIPNLMTKKEIGIVIIDSIAGIFRNEMEYISRAQTMRHFVKLLNKLSFKYNCAVLCTNQVTAAISNDLLASNTQDNQNLPCLGLAWANLVTTRLEVSRTRYCKTLIEAGSNNMPYIVRNLKVVFSPSVPPAQTNFLISSSGVINLPSS